MSYLSVTCDLPVTVLTVVVFDCSSVRLVNYRRTISPCNRWEFV